LSFFSFFSFFSLAALSCASRMRSSSAFFNLPQHRQKKMQFVTQMHMCCLYRSASTLQLTNATSRVVEAFSFRRARA
jgi:hypothetical protein